MKSNSSVSNEAEVAVYEKGVDEAVDLVAGHVDDGPLDVREAQKIRNRLDWVIQSLLFALYTLQLLDNYVLLHGVDCILADPIVDRGTIGASSVLGIIEDNHLTTDQFNTLGSAFYIVILRLLLGASEGCITNGVMLVTPMFYTRTETGERIGWTIQCNGFAQIVSGFLAFGVAHSHPAKKPAPWQLLLIIYTILTLVVETWLLLVFPDSPVRARFLKTEEKRVQLRFIAITLATVILHYRPNARCWIAIGFFVPSVLAVVLLMALPWDNRIGLLCAFYVLNFGGAPSWVMVVSWVAVTTSGHTKKLAVNAIFLVGYSLGQILCTQFWRAAYRPRNYVPWAITLISYIGDFLLLLTIRHVLDRDNKRRDAMKILHGETEYGYISKNELGGQVARYKVDKSMLHD
ncbi:MAG: hypothetical protein Q9226_005076 [Calogaya cf. arnoldii]